MHWLLMEPVGILRAERAVSSRFSTTKCPPWKVTQRSTVMRWLWTIDQWNAVVNGKAHAKPK